MLSLPILKLLQDCCDPPATRESLAALQARLGVTFPEDYVEFLLHFNGGHFKRPVMCYLPEPTELCTGVIVNEFYGNSGEPHECGDLCWVASELKEGIPEGFLAIVGTLGFDGVLMDIGSSSGEFGRIWYWNGAPKWVDEFELHHVADSFNGFLSMLLHDNYWEEDDRETIPVFRAIEYGNLPEVERFLAEGMDVESRNGNGMTLLMSAASYSWPKIVQVLLGRSADPNARDTVGRTPLHHAAGHSLDSVKLLLAAGADARVHDNKRKGVLAGWSSRVDKLLRAHGAED